jgi:LmbE family N-acetylglucosaminyl deacetylase
VLVISAHADDETLGCGGTLLRHRHRGDTIDWLLATDARAGGRWSEAEMAKKEEQIELVRGRYGVRHLTRLGHPAGRLDTIAVGELMNGVEQAVANGHPETVYVVHPGDVHTDHRALFAAAASVLKPFHLRNAGVRRVLTYETLSSTEAAPLGGVGPQVYKDV